ncbi:MAG: DNA translocase FtsK 4TM domain-containing protein [Paludibacteraceae bacterium]|nr:DNA translocase FtsK 4TM domain-containing protein [Paludibacteraceae bacterium]
MATRTTRPTRPTTGGGNKSNATQPTKHGNLWQSLRTFFRSQQCQLIVGILLLFVALMLLIAYISFFFTGANDMSIIQESATRSTLREGVTNALGLPGAVIASWLIDSMFGVLIVLPIVLMGVYALRILFVFPIKAWKLLFCMLFGVVWGSIALGYAQQLLPFDSFFRWGGAFGEQIAQYAISYLQPLGVGLILLAVLIVFLIVADKHFVEHCQQIGAWIANIFKRKPKEEAVDIVLEEESTDPITIEIDDIPADDTSIPDIVLDVEVPQQEETTEEATEELPTPQPEEEEVEVAVEEVKEVELSENDPEYLLKKLGPYDPRKDLEHYKFPSLSLLKVYDNETAPVINQEEQQANANRIVTTLRNYGIEIESIKATVGPTVTLYEIVPQAGVRISKIQNLENDIMLSLSAMGIRIIAPIPGKGTIGIEVPNEKPQVVSMHSVIASKRFQEEQKMKLPISIGRTITNEVFMFDLAKTPHLLVAGATGQGKSVAINAIITSLLYKKHPAELKFVMVDPKMVEFAPYKPLLRHYLAATPDTEDENIVIVDCDKVVNTLNSLVIEMENRYKLLMDAGVRNLEDYNDKFVSRRLNPEKLVAESLHHQFLPYIVIIIDEYGDFIMQAGKQVETPIARITQKARAVGMHMILATQRPSVNIVTGVIKANIPTRIALRTQSVVDSRTVLDTKGADQLIGRGDMLYSGNGNITRLQCAFVDTPEVDAIVEHIEKQQHYFEPYQLPEYIPEGSEGEALAPGAVDLKRLDPMFADVARYVVTKQEGSTSRLQRAFEIGYNRAGKLSDQLEAAGIVGPNKGPKGRDVLIQSLDELDKKLEELGC